MTEKNFYVYCYLTEPGEPYTQASRDAQNRKQKAVGDTV